MLFPSRYRTLSETGPVVLLLLWLPDNLQDLVFICLSPCQTLSVWDEVLHVRCLNEAEVLGKFQPKLFSNYKTKAREKYIDFLMLKMLAIFFENALPFFSSLLFINLMKYKLQSFRKLQSQVCKRLPLQPQYSALGHMDYYTVFMYMAHYQFFHRPPGLFSVQYG